MIISTLHVLGVLPSPFILNKKKKKESEVNVHGSATVPWIFSGKKKRKKKGNESELDVDWKDIAD